MTKKVNMIVLKVMQVQNIQTSDSRNLTKQTERIFEKNLTYFPTFASGAQAVNEIINIGRALTVTFKITHTRHFLSHLEDGFKFLLPYQFSCSRINSLRIPWWCGYQLSGFLHCCNFCLFFYKHIQNWKNLNTATRVRKPSLLKLLKPCLTCSW